MQTVDFFAPIVDDPRRFGEIAAANALSDVFAMGGEPLTALNIVGFPSGSLPLEVLGEILAGGQAKVQEAGALVIGGHTVVDEEVKYGLAVTGRADPRHLLTNAGATAGERLVLTKPIGTGILATAARRREIDSAHEALLLDTMSALNALAARSALAVGSRAATDVTGFGLLGHGSHIARGSRVTLLIDVSAVPVLPGAREGWIRGIRTGGATRNAEWLAPQVAWGSSTEEDRGLLTDPQTSGGLLVAVPAARVGEYLSRVPGAVEIGEVLPAGEHGLVLA